MRAAPSHSEEIIVISREDLPMGFEGDISDTIPLPSPNTRGCIEFHGVSRNRMPDIAELLNAEGATTKEEVLRLIPQVREF